MTAVPDVGKRYKLPSGNQVEVMNIQQNIVICRYLENWIRRPAGSEFRNEVTLRNTFLFLFGENL